MTLKFAVIATAVWTLATAGLGAIAIWIILTHPIPAVPPEVRAAQLGSGMGTLAGIGYAVIWIPFAALRGRQRRAALNAKSQRPMDR